MAWTKYRGRALADSALVDDARDAQLEDHLRAQHPQLTDVRLGQATPTGMTETSGGRPLRWYEVTYFAEGGQDQ